ncbi:ion transporter [Parashewanella curva]|uniref:Ion transporter n=1 Tax=Parashewanella curva TaxID=2338552 RepID=A0A3L8Q2V6_9GAMM|nr:ion transporter [Parashewanella curva]RLV61378.1 ion transporter [Parashewanella curva]
MNTLRLQARFYKLRTNKAFELFVISVIILSAMMIGVKTYELPVQVEGAIRVLDFAITLFFLCEISVRFIGENRKLKFFKSAWNVFDTAIVILSLVPIENSEMAMIGRLIRVFRVLRMVSIIPELRMLLNSLLKALPQLGYIGLLMFIIFYIYAAIGTTFFASINPELWDNISISMLTLFRVMTFEDWTDVMYETMAHYPLSWAYYLSFIFLTAFAFLNMIIGIVVNVLEDERQKIAALKAKKEASTQPSLSDLQAQLEEMKALLLKQQK